MHHWFCWFLLLIFCGTEAQGQAPPPKMRMLKKCVERGQWEKTHKKLEQFGEALERDYPVSINVLWGMSDDYRGDYQSACDRYRKAYQAYYRAWSVDTLLLKTFAFAKGEINGYWLRDTLWNRSECLSYSERAIISCNRSDFSISEASKLLNLAKQHREHILLPNAYHFACGLRLERGYNNMQDSACTYYRKIDIGACNKEELYVFFRQNVSPLLAQKKKECMPATPAKELPKMTVEQALLWIDSVKTCDSLAKTKIKKWLSESLSKKENQIAPYAYLLLRGIYSENCVGDTALACQYYTMAKTQIPSYKDDSIVAQLQHFDSLWFADKMSVGNCIEEDFSGIWQQFDSINLRIMEYKQRLKEYSSLPSQIQAAMEEDLARLGNGGAAVKLRVAFAPHDSTSVMVEFRAESTGKGNPDFLFLPGESTGMQGYVPILESCIRRVLSGAYALDEDSSQTLVRVLATADGNTLRRDSKYETDILNPVEYFHLQDSTLGKWKTENAGTPTTIIPQQEQPITDQEICALRAYFFAKEVQKALPENIPINVQIFAYDYPDEEKYCQSKYRFLEVCITFKGILKKERKELQTNIAKDLKILEAIGTQLREDK